MSPAAVPASLRSGEREAGGTRLAPSEPIRVLFLIRSLDIGGAERQLHALVAGLDKSRFAVTVATIYDQGEMRAAFASLPGVRTISLHKQRRWDVRRFSATVWRTVRAERPHILHGYMGGANELSLVVGRLFGVKVVWGIRVSNLDFSRYIWSVGFLFRVGRLLSPLPDLIIANSESGRATHVARGYNPRRMIVIPNGIDTARFSPDLPAGRRWREAMGYGDRTPVIGCLARLDPMKDHPTFLRGAALVADTNDAVRFVCAGGGNAAYGARLKQLAAELGLGDRVAWIPAAEDPRGLYNGLDIVTSASAFGEGFPNILGEAMACEVPCVATDVGDSAAVIGDAGSVVPAGDAAALAAAWRQILGMPLEERAALGRRARDRIVREFTTARLAERTGAALEALVKP